MTDRTFFLSRNDLSRIFGGNRTMIAQFETLQEKVATTETVSTAAVSETQALRDATFVTLSANAELTNERVLTLGPGLSFNTGTAGQVMLSANLYSDSGWTVRLNAVGATELQLPLAGVLATTGGTETLTNKTLNSPKLSGLVNAADDTAAASAGVPVGGVYRDGSNLKFRVS